MKNGKFDGKYVEFMEGGHEFIQMEYANGNHANDWYFKSNDKGAYGRFRFSDDSMIHDDFDSAAMLVKWIDGVPWVTYITNGMRISMSVKDVKEYGAYHQVSIVVDNSSYLKYEIEPSVNVYAASGYSAGSLLVEAMPLEVFSYENYMRKVKNQQTLAAIAMGLSSAAAAISSAYSPSTWTVSVNGHQTYIDVSGRNINFYSPDLAFAGVAESWGRDRQIIQKGYLKKNTIESGEVVSGYFNIKEGAENFLSVTFKINGLRIPFFWDVSETIAKPIDYQSVSHEWEKQLEIKQELNGFIWQSKLQNIAIRDITNKSGTSITICDLGETLIGKKLFVLDINGEHRGIIAEKESHYTFEGEHFDAHFHIPDYSVVFPFSLICEDNPSIRINNIRKEAQDWLDR